MNRWIFDLIYWGTLIVIIGSILVLSITAFIVRDVKHIKEHPIQFLVETGIIGFLMGAIILVMGYLRNIPWEQQKILFFTLAMKIIILHVLFELSGVYTVGFASPATIKSKFH
jgi:hypothetical protein